METDQTLLALLQAIHSFFRELKVFQHGEHRLKPVELFVLQEIQEIGYGRGMELAKKMQIAPSTMSMLIDELVTQGLLARKQVPRDRRVIMLEITKQGSDRLQAEANQFLSELSSLRTYLSNDEITLLTNLLSRALQALEEKKEEKSYVET
ncbi:MAG: MarR family winged helix-turn-helix transcriptional regulator [Erysipelotrichaceae bacterium]